MFPMFWASALAAIGWLWVGESLNLSALYGDAKYKTRMGMIENIETRFVKRQPVSRVVLLIVAVMAVLPFGATVISPAWLSTGALIVLTLLLLGAWLFVSPYATPVYAEAGRTDTGEGEASIEYKFEKLEQNHIKVLAILLVPIVVWAIVTWILSAFRLSGWVLMGATTAIGVTLTIVFTNVLHASLQDFTK